MIPTSFCMMEIYPANFLIIHSIGPLENFFLHNTLIKMLKMKNAVANNKTNSSD